MVGASGEGATLDKAHDRVSTIISEAKENIEQIQTEEDAKIQIITRVLTEGLGWSFVDIGAERSHDSGYSDYMLSLDERPVLLLEAKRIGRVNIKAADISRLKHYKLSGPALREASEGIEQAAGYAAPNGVQVAVLTDGVVWIVFKTFIPGAHYLEKQAFVFGSFEAVLGGFSEFFDLLSKESISRRAFSGMFDALHNERLALDTPLVAPLRDDEIHIQQKSRLAFDLERVFSTFFSRLSGDDDEEILIDCFVETRESRVADFSLEKITANVLGNLSPVGKDVNKELANVVEAAVDVDRGKTVFIVGPTGAGKSTFLDRFFKKTLPKALRDRCVVCRINCLDFSGEQSVSLKWLTESLISSLEKQVYTEGSPDWDELQGLYFSEYRSRARGVDSQLYNSDRQAFKIKFGEFLESVVQSDREGYLKRVLSDVVRNRKKLPIIVIDNMDEFVLENKASIFQFSQSMARHTRHCLLIFPVTDKTAWSFSKTDIFSIYQSLSFFLPTPPPREVFRKRIEFLKLRLDDVAEGRERKEYFTGRGINIEIGNLVGFAKVLESVFVDDYYTAKTIGELTNYNIRQTLLLSKRVITSSVLDVEDLVKSFLKEQFSLPNYAKFVNALLKGDYDAYRKNDEHHVFPVFQADSEIRQSPLLILRILRLLETQKNAGRTIDDRHIGPSSIVDYFDALGVPEVAVDKALLSLLEANLIEPFDSSLRGLEPTQKLSITHSGHAHLRLATKNFVFLEQMAITTAISDSDEAESIRSAYQSHRPFQEKMREVRDTFIQFLLNEDAELLTVPEDLDQYEPQRDLTRQISALLNIGAEESASNKERNLNEMICQGSVATIDWFDREKGYGFAYSDGVDGGIFVHISALKAKGIDDLSDGDEILCDIERSDKGLQVAAVHDIQTDPSRIVAEDCEVIRLYPERQYGFVRGLQSEQEAFFHYSLVAQADRSKLNSATKLHAEIGQDKKGRGPQVRRVISIDQPSSHSN